MDLIQCNSYLSKVDGTIEQCQRCNVLMLSRAFVSNINFFSICLVLEKLTQKWWNKHTRRRLNTRHRATQSTATSKAKMLVAFQSLRNGPCCSNQQSECVSEKRERSIRLWERADKPRVQTSSKDHIAQYLNAKGRPNVLTHFEEQHARPKATNGTCTKFEPVHLGLCKAKRLDRQGPSNSSCLSHNRRTYSVRTRTKKRVPASCTVPWNQGGSKQASKRARCHKVLSISLARSLNLNIRQGLLGLETRRKHISWMMMVEAHVPKSQNIDCNASLPAIYESWKEQGSRTRPR